MTLPLREGCEPRCPGCAQRALSAGDSAAQKEGWLHRRLASWRDTLAPLHAVTGEARWNYRDRVRLAARWRENAWRFGLLARRELIAIPDCPIHSHRVRAALQLLGPALPPGPVFPLAFIVQAGAQLTLVLKTAAPPGLEWVDAELTRRLAEIGMEGLWLHLHPAAGRRLFTKNGWRLLWGQARSRDSDGLWYGPTAFQQVLPALYRRALVEAETFVQPSADAVMVDLYCGNGASLTRWTRRGVRTVGVELGGEAVECAQRNAPGALLLRGKCADRIAQLEEWLNRPAGAARRLLYLNPPRTGVEPEVLRWTVANYRPERIAYLSCSAGTLKRDLEVLTAAVYRVERITPYDFFPQTYHVETLVLLQRTS